MQRTTSIFSIIIGCMFAFSGVLKLLDLATFYDSIFLFQIIPINYIVYAALIIPSLELVCGIGLILNVFRRSVSLLLVGLLIIFCISIILNILRDNVFYCGCFGSLQIFGEISPKSVLFNTVLIIILALIIKNSGHRYPKLEEYKIVGFFTLLFALFANIQLENTNIEFALYQDRIKNISYNEAQTLIKEQDGILVDARDIESYTKKHIKNAILIPAFEFKKYYSNIADHNRDRPILIYCYHAYCTNSIKVGVKLLKNGFKEIYNINKGVEIWEKLKKQ